MDIKIVGSVTDESALDEIESIMNVFAYEQRIKNYTSLICVPHLTKKQNQFDKKQKMNNKILPSIDQRIPVKGLY